MSAIDEGLEAQIRNIEERYGKPLSEWIGIVRESGITKHTDRVAMLKSHYGMSHASAHRVVLKARDVDGANMIKAAKAAGQDAIDEMYSGKKVDLKPLHDTLMTAITSFGNDIEVAPKKGYVSLRRKKQFAMIQPTTATRLDIGFILKDAHGLCNEINAGSTCTGRNLYMYRTLEKSKSRRISHVMRGARL